MPPALPPGRTTASPARAPRPRDRAARVRFRRALTLMVMTLFAPRLRPAGRRQPRGRPDRACGSGSAARRRSSLVVRRCGLVWHELRLLAGQQHRAARLAPAALMRAGRRLGRALRRRLAARPAADAAHEAAAARWSASTACSASRSPARCSSAPTWSACSATSSSAMFGDGDGHRRPRTAATTCCCSAATPAPDRWGLRPDSHDGRQHRRRDRQDGPVRAAAQHGELPVRQGLGDGTSSSPTATTASGCDLNGVSTWAGDHTELFPASENPGVDATIMALEGITGLKINY